ncbi:MAG: hypothetical protein IPO93_09675 [Actinobacteria bacterium]|nr:hypothetical protein [Actinomycetota bacterium]
MTSSVAMGRDPIALTNDRSLRARFDAIVAAEFAAQPLQPSSETVTSADLAGLPDPVRRYVERSGAVGRPRPQNMRVVLDAYMYRKPGQSPMRARSVQYTFFGRPTRIFLMEARMFGLPVRALHVYREEAATFTVRVASTVNMVNLRGPEISAAETVTVLNDLCLMAPGALLDPRLAWTEVDRRTARVMFANGPHRVAATLEFNDDAELTDFWSDDRPDSSGGSFVPMRWHTPISEHCDIDGMHLLHRGGAVYDRPDGPFMYGDFTLNSIGFDVAGPVPT